MNEHISAGGLTIEQLDNSQWREYKAIRLQALQNDPQAFLSTFARESAFSDETWQQRLQTANQGETSWMYFARQNGDVVGMT